ncbi:NADP-dependent oxidoreductase [Loigolactobacillus binensis]|uniref:NADP-dependent oxidoreductase n=1 Tax=Loigolactobacillus binensis TaxID=2559922 RepID=A0ABW3EEZ0_9LACO|nr:NADP-dependent oxidoreductase [Loigolactobacillus binensis]
MKAAVINEYGSVDQLKIIDIALPKIKADEVLIAVKATAVNPVDWKLRRGDLKVQFPWAFPIILGWDVSGVVLETGRSVTNVKVGDAVFARPDMSRLGTYAQQTIVKANKVTQKPKNLTFNEAAAVPLTAITAWQVIHDQLNIKSGQQVLIQAGAGGIGMFAIQFANELGAKVVTTASRHNFKFVKDLGATTVIDYHEQSITDLTTKFDAVFDTIGAISEGMQTLKPNGRLVSIEKDPGKQKWPHGKTASYWWTDPNNKDLKTIAKMLEQDKIVVPIDRLFPFTEQGVRAAQRLSESHQATGKIVISMTAQ